MAPMKALPHSWAGRRFVVSGLLAALLAACSTPPQRLPAEAQPDAQPVAPMKAPSVELGRGMASWYGPGFHGRRTASGERFDMNQLTAAHRTLPFGSLVLVRNTQNGREVVVRINDRGPHVRNRIIDLSKAAAELLDMVQSGEVAVVLTGF